MTTTASILILRHTDVRLVGLVDDHAVTDGELAAWTNPCTGKPEVLGAGQWASTLSSRKASA